VQVHGAPSKLLKPAISPVGIVSAALARAGNEMKAARATAQSETKNTRMIYDPFSTGKVT
jgi:hypothetical protein